MIMKKIMKNKYILSLVVTIILFSLSCIFNKFDFNYYEATKNIKFLYLYLRFTFFIVLYFLILKLLNFYLRLKANDLKAKKYLKYFILVFCIIMIFALLMWPGTWVWDEFWSLEEASKVIFSSWQSYLTIIFYSHCLMLCYKAQTVIIVQIIIISSIISYVMNNIKPLVKKEKLVYLFLIPLILPAVILNNLYPLRLTIYAYIELLLLFKSYLIYKQQLEVNIVEVVKISICIFILVIWRTEGMFYLLFYLFFGCLILKNKKQRIIMVVAICLCLSLYTPVYLYQKKYDDRSYAYKTTAIINPLSMLLQEDLSKSTHELKLINNVLNIKEIKKKPSYIEIPSYWNGNILQDDYINHYGDLYKGYSRLILKNPSKFIKVRMKTFLATNGFDKYTSLHNNDFSSKKSESNKWYCQLKKSIFSFKLRNTTMNILNNESTFFRIIFWDCIPFIVFDIYVLIKMLIKKKWIKSIFLIFILLRPILVFATASANYFMYYFPTYLISLYLIIYYFLKKKEV